MVFEGSIGMVFSGWGGGGRVMSDVTAQLMDRSHISVRLPALRSADSSTAPPPHRQQHWSTAGTTSDNIELLRQ